MKIILLLICSMLFINTHAIENREVLVIPGDNFTEKELVDLELNLRKYFLREFGVYLQMEVDPKVKLPKTLMNPSRTRYNATKVVKHFQTNSKIIQVVLLKRDIFTYRNGNKEWGILGQSLLDGNTCVVSTYRLRNKSNLWKLVLHEYIHTYFKYYHCPNDDPKCFMKDAKGHANLDKQKYLCPECVKKLKYEKINSNIFDRIVNFLW